MDCNKEAAIMAKELAEKRFAKENFVGAKTMATRAQNLFPELEGISHFLATLDVFIASMKKINDQEHDWYEILNVHSSESNDGIRKQYLKLALSLHPDKNKSVGAESAFKWISEAFNFLSDKSKRAAYDKKRVLYDVTKKGVETPEADLFSETGKSSGFTKNSVRSSNAESFPETEKSRFGGWPAYSNADGLNFFPNRMPRSNVHMGGGVRYQSNADSFDFFAKTTENSRYFPGRGGVPTQSNADGFDFFQPKTARPGIFMGSEPTPPPPNTDYFQNFARKPPTPSVNAAKRSKRAKSTTRVGSSSTPLPEPKTPDKYLTICEKCKMRYKYDVFYRNHAILCLNCNKPFLAYETSPPTNGDGNDGVGSSHQ